MASGEDRNEVDYIKLAATVRHIQETVFHRASDNGIKLTPETVKMVLRDAIDLAFVAHVPAQEIR